MQKQSIFMLSLLSTALFVNNANAAVATQQLDEIRVTAESQVKQSLGVSIVSEKDLAKRPVTNDISEVLRTMPGVNLTGNSATGQRGNKRQIDIRGMGPENTLILVDGKPVTSRNAERYGVRGERNSRGDSNWIPIEAIESVEVLRGPAAARYGSGAMGGVVNIITKPVTNDLHGSVSYYTNQPEDRKEGATNRVGFNLSGALIKDILQFRLYGNWNKTQADDVGINGDPAIAGREGVRNKDINGRLVWNINEKNKLTLDSGFSRQGNIYNGDTQNSSAGLYNNKNYPETKTLAGSKAETARLYRQNYALTYEGKFDHFDNKTYITFDKTKNSRLPEYLAGGPEGSYSSTSAFSDSILKNTRFSSEFYIPFTFGVEHMLTVGFEGAHSSLDDASSMTQLLGGRRDRSGKVIYDLPETLPSGVHNVRGGHSSQSEWAFFIEDNISATKSMVLTPSLRYDYNTYSGSNISGGLNFLQGLTEHWKIKGGIARAYKAPNLYQTNPNYLLFTLGQGCPTYVPNGKTCYFQGNSEIKPETSWNKEIGIEYDKDGLLASIAYFRNDYRNKIVSDGKFVGLSTLGNYVYKWGNANRAVIEGLEGNLTLPLIEDKLSWVNNFTYMHKTKNKDTGNPLSIVPKYTLNSSLNYQITEAFDTMLTYTQYGKQTSRKNPENRMESGKLANSSDIGSYAIWGLSAGYNWKNTVSVRVGVNNLFDKRLYRSSSSTNYNAHTYNEPGRAYYATLKYTF
ncbi:FepA family TonB-dependent siderophore receptor [Aggregatibacter segnis]|jgi:tonB-dependent siderophore receptor|uniref:Outer membrane ferric enterobactin receptor n=1 Tax=Aggregatibacter segnis ATCC 33393 TaxID=888057 RepID=E6KZP2_9PAST|nr:FepA family TonB-dependent siderophore receptor [Aggregatibacter segnis]EFU66989.1 outer membrane ferric enterobactin receptor [Aggregatibacter segnis ATCC 33393]QQB08718.1 FepA family TonB-dependent siderophore receptor [Aggregatibacter segnis]SQH63670.1 Enterobactin outer-membrane receptor [Aggregatibacter segnis ATCC 33393]